MFDAYEFLSGVVGSGGLIIGGVSLYLRRPQPHSHRPQIDFEAINRAEVELGLGMSDYRSQGVDSASVVAEAAERVVRENQRVIEEAEETLDPLAAVERHIARSQAVPSHILGGTSHRIQTMDEPYPVEIVPAVCRCHFLWGWDGPCTKCGLHGALPGIPRLSPDQKADALLAMWAYTAPGGPPSSSATERKGAPEGAPGCGVDVKKD